jgi:hypothetical protein
VTEFRPILGRCDRLVKNGPQIGSLTGWRDDEFFCLSKSRSLTNYFFVVWLEVSLSRSSDCHFTYDLLDRKPW